jgi:hypothetical protein
MRLGVRTLTDFAEINERVNVHEREWLRSFCCFTAFASVTDMLSLVVLVVLVVPEATEVLLATSLIDLCSVRHNTRVHSTSDE